MPFDLLIRGAKVFTGDGPAHRADIGVADGRISAVEPRLPTESAGEVIDAARFIDTATYDDPKQVPEGISRVFVAGRTVWAAGAPTGVLPGDVIREPLPRR